MNKELLKVYCPKCGTEKIEWLGTVGGDQGRVVHYLCIACGVSWVEDVKVRIVASKK